jgi:D-arabinose 1-dehydrogenase-like Zn-dependent alcohol dehydrogenase
LIVGVPESLDINPLPLILGSRSVKGWYSGTSIDSQQTLAFSALTGVRSMIGIGGRLAAPPLPHHRAYGSRTAAVRRG